MSISFCAIFAIVFVIGGSASGGEAYQNAAGAVRVLEH